MCSSVAASNLIETTKKRQREDDGNAQLASTKQKLEVKFQLLMELPSAILQHSIFPYLSTNDLTVFAGTSKKLDYLVDDYRRPLPYIYKQELLPRYMSFINFRRRGIFPFLQDPSRINTFDVHSAQTIRFLLKTELHGIVQLDICLTEYIWTELNGTTCYRGLSEEDRCVWVEIKIFQKTQKNTWERMYESTPPQLHPNTGSVCASHFLKGYENNPSDTVLFFYDRPEFDRQQEIYDPKQVPENVQTNQKACTQYILACARRLEAFPAKYNFPNAQYTILSALPKEFYRFLPDNLELDAAKAIGPKTFPKWKHRFPDTPSIWRNFLWTMGSVKEHDEYGQFKIDYEIHEIPWYQDWYPKPTILNPKHLLRSLPKTIMRENIVGPFLGSNLHDVAALEEVLGYSFTALDKAGK